MMCPPCTDRMMRWLDTTPQGLFLGIKITDNAAYDGTPAGSADNRRARCDRWRQVVRFQISLIRDLCAAQHSKRAA